MALGNSETWFWRFVGICAIAVCTLNVMVLMKGNDFVYVSYFYTVSLLGVDAY